MARKNLLQSLIEDAATPTRPASDPPTPKQKPSAEKRPYKGAIGAVSQSIEALKARSLLDIDPHDIDAGGMQDRLETDDAEDASLLASIREYGQQVPVLVRPHPDTEGRYQIVYGRRRVLALRELGQPVKALVRDLDEHALVMAQGQENTARRGLSFIEKANFAAQMRDAGYKRKFVIDALSIDKTVVSRMLAIVDRLGPELVQAIGAAPTVGRDRWVQLAALIDEHDLDIDTLIDMIGVLAGGGDSNQRFEAALGAALRMSPDASDAPKPVSKQGKTGGTTRRTINGSATGTPFASVVAGPEKVVLTLPREGGGGFEDWLVEHLSEIHRNWANSARNDE
jgi:ParB family transcriptional regulator, chromosome partitioning protein